ncbi:hypothetical protein N0V90_007724 [Kalmusia sp. IMI 367209]|nr:hypothetical protein N0V90_007724 [Kalmusia sp. IMI 367209]
MDLILKAQLAELLSTPTKLRELKALKMAGCNSKTPPNQRPFPFLELPAELRMMVYKELSVTTVHRNVDSEKAAMPGTNPLNFKLVHFGIPVQLLATCRLIQEEAKDILQQEVDLIRSLVPKMIVEINENDFPRGVGGTVQLIGLWHQDLMENPDADFNRWIRLKQTLPITTLRFVEQAGHQLFRRWRILRHRQRTRRPGAQQNILMLQFRVQDDGVVRAHPCENGPQSIEDQFNVVDKGVSKAIIQRLQPKTRLGSPLVNMGSLRYCACPDPTKLATVIYGWVPRGSLSNYSHPPGALSSEEKAWNRFEYTAGWIEGEEVIAP